MRLSYELHARFFAEFTNARDNNKRNVSEAEFADFEYTTQQIMDRLQQQAKMVGDYWIADYSIYSVWSDLYVPHTIKPVDSLMFVNLKDNGLVEGDHELDWEHALYSTQANNNVRPSYAEQVEHHAEVVERIMHGVNMNNAQEVARAQARCPEPPQGRRAQILSPQDYKDVQNRMLTQLKITSGSFSNVNTKDTDLRKTLSFDKLDGYCFNNLCYSNTTNGFRPIALKCEMVTPLLDLAEFRGNAQDNFVWWFRNAIAGVNNN